METKDEIIHIAMSNLQILLAKEKQAGIKEVVEWGETICMEHGMRKRRKCDRCWQAKLKEWGIEK